MKKGVCFTILIFLIGLISIFFTMPKLNIVGSDVILLLNSSYIEQGYSSSILGSDITNLVKVNSDIDTSKVGNYTVTYKVKSLFTRVKTRNVYVVEKDVPTLILEGNKDVYICPGMEYIEPGYKADDNYDGNITNNIVVTKENDYIMYEVTDSSGNYVSTKRNIKYEDIEKPTIELSGDSNIYLGIGETYTEPGYKAYDNCMGDLTDKVVVTNNIDSSKVGNYKVTYEVSDDKNQTKVERNIYVVGKAGVLGTVNTPGVIYLTFDDGPSYYTTKILDALDKYNVKATFFVVPKNSGYYYLIKRAYDSGHSIGIHSLSHNYASVYASDNALYSDISSTNERIKSITGSYTHLYRYPGGSSNTISMNYSTGIISRSSLYLHSNGYHYFDWNISSGDASSSAKYAYQIYNNVIKGLSKNRPNVVLMHDTKSYTADAVEDIIKYGLANGYTFSNITMDTKEVHHSIAN